LWVGFIDSNWDNDPDYQKSTTLYVFSVGFRHVTLACKKQQDLSLSSVEAEYRPMINASQEEFWIQYILSNFGIQ
jgi:hypothetical protein